MITLSVSITTKRYKDKWYQSFDVMEGELLSGCGLYHTNGDHITKVLVEEFERMYPDYTCYCPQVRNVLDDSRENISEEDSICCNTVIQLDIDEGSLEKHISCWNLPNNVVTRKSVKENGIPQCDVQHHLERSKSDVTDFFTKNECSVCLCNYKDILEDDRHIVIPACGHPICCSCSDRMLRLDPKCPLCREYMDVNTIEPMRFDLSLEPHSRNTKYYL